MTTAVLEASGDTYVRSGIPNQNRGGDTQLSLQAIGKHRALLFFSSGAIDAAVGSGALLSARIELALSSTVWAWGPSGRLIAIHPLKQPSGEYQATWSCALDGNVANQQVDCSGADGWNMSASDPALQPWLSPPSATALITNGQTGSVSFDVTADVAAILSGASAGHGWLIKKVDEGQTGTLDFASREVGPAPKLALEIEGGPGGQEPPGPVTGSTVVVISADSHIRQGQPNQSFGSDPSLPIQSLGRHRALLGVDATATVAALEGPLVRARLQLPIAASFDHWGPDRAIGAHPLRQAWSEAGATWNCAVDTDTTNTAPDCAGDTAWVMWGGTEQVPWINPPSGTALISNGQTGAIELDVTRDIACHLAGYAPLRGWLVKKEVESQNGRIELASRETATPPTLLLEWTDTNGTGITVAQQACAASGPPSGCTPSAQVDETCNGLDDDCDGVADDDYVVTEISCGSGACTGTGSTSCIDGVVASACTFAHPDDGNPCTADSCDAAGIPVHSPVAAGTPCLDGDVCNGAEACNANGACVSGEPLVVDDGDPCTADGCDAVLGVSHVPAAAGTSCADEYFCNGQEVCDEMGVCVVSLPVDIDDGEPCTADHCSEAQGVTHTPLAAGSACSDGDVCNGTETCSGSGACLAGTPLASVASANPCVADTTCDPISGPQHSFAPLGVACGPGFICDGAGSCLRDQGNGTPAPPLPPGAIGGITAYGPALPREPLQDCALEPLVADHVAVIAGRVLTWDAVLQQRIPVSGARVSVPRHCEFGFASTWVDGTFRLPITGGGEHMIRVEADANGDGTFDYLPVERSVETGWRTSVGIGEVELVLPAAVSAQLELTAGSVTQNVIVNGPQSEDDRDGDGIPAPRIPSVLFKAGTVLTGVDGDGAEIELEEAAIRMTEYTVGAGGTLRMPAPMPPGTGYGYAIELSVDGAEHVFFDRPAVFYVDNFLGAEAERTGTVSTPHQVGLPVPAWYYERQRGAWARQDDGLIIALLGVDGSSPPRALIDADGDGDADAEDESYLLAYNQTVDVTEREQLAEELLAGRRAEGSELWRVEILHFSSYDWNWLLHCGEQCLVGDLLKTATLGGVAGPEICKVGSSIDVESMTLRESLPIAGTPLSLNYSSRAVYGYQPRRQQAVHRSIPALPAPLSVASIRERLFIAGKSMSPEGCEFTPSGHVCHEYDGFTTTPTAIQWDGRDADGQIAYGTHRGGWGVTTTIQAQTSSAVFTRDLMRSLPVQMTVYDAKILGLGGWTLSPHHFFDPEAALLFRGDGGEARTGTSFAERLFTLPSGTSAAVPGGLRVMPDGSLFIQNSHFIWRLTPQGQLETWVDGGTDAMAPDGEDRLFVGDSTNQPGDKKIRRLERVGGTIRETASVTPQTGINAGINALTIGPDNLLYVLLQTTPLSVHRYTLDLQHADGGARHFSLPGVQRGVTFSAMSFHGETLYVAAGRVGAIFRYGPDDQAPVQIAGKHPQVPLVEGQPAASYAGWSASYTSVRGTPDGVLFATDGEPLWLIDNDGLLRRVAGDPQAAAGTGDGGPALRMGLGIFYSFDVAPDGNVVLYLRSPTSTIRRIRPPGPEGFSGPASYPSEDGRLSYEFDIDGHHRRTRNVATNAVMFSFEYEGGLLSAIVEGDHESPEGPTLPRTRIVRAADDLVTIEAPSGQRTTIALDPTTGYASRIVDPDGAIVSLTHDADGLLRSMTDQRGFVHAYDYDEDGRLVSDTSPGLPPQTLHGTALSSVTHENGEREQSRYEVTLDQSTGLLTRTQQNSDGSSMTQTLDKTLQRQQLFSDGTVVDEMFAPHPIFTTAAPILAARTTRLPSGLTRSESHTLSLASGVWTETFGLNGKISTTQTHQSLNTVITTTAEGRTVATTLDTHGRPTHIQVGDLEPTLFSYDHQGRPDLVTSGSGPSLRRTLLGYFPDETGTPEAGYLSSITDATNHTVTFTRDAFGRPLTATLEDHTTELAYSPSGDLEQVTTANQDTHFQIFDGIRQLTQYIAPEAPDADTLTEYAYDQARRLGATTLPGDIQITYSRDPADPNHPERQGRLRSAASLNQGNGTSPLFISYTYADEPVCPDPNNCPEPGPPGQLKALTRGDITTVLSFDGFIPIRETHTISPASSTALTSTEYQINLNAAFQAQSDQVEAKGNTSTATYGYDDDNVLTCASHGTSCNPGFGVLYQFDSGPTDSAPSGHGLLESTTAGSITETFTHNPFGELATHTVNLDGTPALTITYDNAAAPRDPLGRISTKILERGTETTSTTYGYDAKGQLLTVEASGQPLRTNIYDPNGNRLCIVEVPATECADPAIYDAQDRLLAYDGVEYLYTDRGSLFQRDDGISLETFTYDALGNLTRVERDGEPAIDYIVDAQSRRVGKHVGGTLQTQYVWSSALRIVAELDASGAVTSRFIYGNKVNVPDLVVKPISGGSAKIYRIITDHLGSPIFVVNIADPGDVMLDATYDEWGNVTQYTSSSGIWPIPFGFAGGLYDEDTGLVRFGARDYDPRIGRWTSKDPIRWEGGQANFYVYAGEDPTNGADPSGAAVPGMGHYSEEQKLLSRASRWLLSAAGKDWSAGNYGSAILNGASSFATGIFAVLSNPAIDAMGFATPLSAARVAERAALRQLTKEALERGGNALTRQEAEILTAWAREQGTKGLIHPPNATGPINFTHAHIDKLNHLRICE